MKSQNDAPTVVLHDSIEVFDKVSAHIKVLQDDEWVGDFWVDFETGVLGGRECFVADWSTVKSGGNGIYVDDHPCFWMVEEIVDELSKRYPGAQFKAIDSGPSDK